MALADIVNRITEDAKAEAAALVDAANAEAAQRHAAAREHAERESAAILSRGAADSAAEAETVRAAARLAARDQLVAAKGVLVDAVLGEAARAVVEFPDDTYVELVARRIAEAARGGERVLIAPADGVRFDSRLPDAIRQAAGRDLGLVFADEPAQVEHGVVLVGDRSEVDLSVSELVEERRDRLAMLAAEVLFGDGDKTGA